MRCSACKNTVSISIPGTCGSCSGSTGYAIEKLCRPCSSKQKKCSVCLKKLNSGGAQGK